jgi:putative transposase
VSFSVEITRYDPAPARPESVVGVDLGIKSLAVLSTGEVIANPRHLEIAQRELRRLQRQASRRVGPDRRTRQVASARWRKTQARLSALHTAVANARRDGLHKLTTRLVRGHGTIVIEDLNVAGMTKNRRARHVADVGMGELRRQVEYKTGWSGVRVHIANRWYPSSKTCSGFGMVKTKLRLSDRTYTCGQCGLVLDRDLNAARNLAALVDEVTGCGGGESRRDSPLETHVRPAPRGQRVPPPEDPRVNARTARRGLRTPSHTVPERQHLSLGRRHIGRLCRRQGPRRGRSGAPATNCASSARSTCGPVSSSRRSSAL